MVVYGYAKKTRYTASGTLEIQVRIPNIHGPYKQSDAKGKTIKGYVKDEDLPYYQSVILPHAPSDGEVVALVNIMDSDKNSDFLVMGYTGATYNSASTDMYDTYE